MVRVAVLDDWQSVAHELADWSVLDGRAEVVFFRQPLGDEQAVAATLADFDVVVAMRERTAFTASLVGRLPKLRLLTFTGARNAAVDDAACTALGILVCRTGAGTRGSAGTAELALSLMLNAARRLPHADAEMRAGRFQENTRPGLELRDRTLGLVGLGKIGAQMAKFGHALGMDVIAWSQNLTAEKAQAEGAKRVERGELFARADVVSVHLVLSDRSRGIVGQAEIAAMKPGAILVNTSRAPLIDGAALLAAVQAGRIVAAIDVYDSEPLSAADPLRAAPNTVLTPHLGYVTGENMGELYRDSVANIAAWLDGKPVRVVNEGVVARD